MIKQIALIIIYTVRVLLQGWGWRDDEGWHRPPPQSDWSSPMPALSQKVFLLANDCK